MIYLVKPTGEFVGAIGGLKAETCSLNQILTDMWEITFEVDKYTDINYSKLSDNYDSISKHMQIVIETDRVNTMFIIDSEPTITNNGIQETKAITAHTTECELQSKFLRLFYINTGHSTGKEYLATNNINPYTQLPNEYVSLVNFDNHELSLLHLALEQTGWSVDEDLINTEPDMCKKKYNFEVEEQDVYSFLMNTLASTAKIIFDFDRRNRVVSFRSFENLGEDTGISIGLRNLANQIDIESTSEDALVTKYKPTCGGDLGIEYVNFGDPYLYNMDYFVNTHSENGDYKYVTDSFHDEYVAWMQKRNDNRSKYIELTKLYNKYLIEIDELTNRLPNDGCNIDYKTFKADELYFSLNAYENAISTLITLYKEDYQDIYVNDDIELDEEHLKGSMYWYDYYAYKYQIIPSILEAMKIWYETDSDGNLVVGNDGKYIVCENGNPIYAANIDIVKPVDSFKYEFELYGLDELKSKKKAWMECVNLLYKDGFIKTGTKNDPKEYIAPDETGWNSLTNTQKEQFTSITSFKDNLNDYLDYMSFDIRDNSIICRQSKGIIRLCEDAIVDIENKISALQSLSNSVFEERNALSSSMLPENNFSNNNIKLFRLLTHEVSYKNDNIVTTNLDDILTIVDIEEELYQDAMTQLAIVSQPQYAFKTTIDNLFAIDKFEQLREDFDIGNFIRLSPDMFDDNYVRLRLISINMNPLVRDRNISIEFSTMTKSLSNVSDLAFLFEQNTSSSNSGASGSGSSGGTYGKNDAEIQIANNMLNALLKTETFGTSISDVILDSIKANKGNFGKLLANSGVFENIETGKLRVNGECLLGQILKSINYEKGISGSMINLIDGSFSFAGDSLTYDPQNGLSISDKDGSTNITGGCITTGMLKSANWNGTEENPISNTKGSILRLEDGILNFGGGKLVFDGKDLNIDGKVIKGETAEFTQNVKLGDNHFIKNDGAEYTGNSATASKLKNPVNINLSGDVSGSGSFDGAEDIDINVSILKDTPLRSIATFSCDGWEEGQIAYSFDTSEYDANNLYDRAKFLLYMIGSSSNATAYGTDDRISFYLITRIVYGTNVQNKSFKLKLVGLGSYGSSTRWSFPIEVDSSILDIKVSKGSWISGKIWMLT